MSKRRRVNETNYYTLYYDPCDNHVGTRYDYIGELPEPKDPKLLYNVMTFHEMDDNTIILDTYCNKVKFCSEFNIFYIFYILPLRIHTDVTKVLLDKTNLVPDVVGIINSYARVYSLTYHDFKYGVDCLYGHPWNEEEKKKWELDLDDEHNNHCLVNYLPPTSLVSMYITICKDNPECLEVTFETND